MRARGWRLPSRRRSPISKAVDRSPKRERSNAATREKLLAAALRLFADRGVESVSLREIAREAEQGNVSALQYHFGGKENLLVAVLEPFCADVDGRRASLLDEIESRSSFDVRDMAGALVRPMAHLLTDPAGRAYLRIVGQLMAEPDPKEYYDVLGPMMPTFARWRELVGRILPEEAVLLHVRATANQMSAIEMRRRAEMPPRRDHRMFISRLIDVVAGVLAAPVSEETARLMAERPRKKSG